MNGEREHNIVRWLPLGIGLGASLVALSLAMVAALFAAHPGIPSAQPPLGNAMGVARSYLFRNAWGNSALVVTVVTAGVFVIARALPSRLLRTGDTQGAVAVWLLALACTPVFLPVPIAALLWSPLLERIDGVGRLSVALLAIALIQVWRLWPLALLLLPLSQRISPGRRAAVAALAAAWLALLDVGTPLLATGGEPFNETHLAATWAFQTVWVSRLWGHGAVMAGGLALISGVLGLAIWRLGPGSVARPGRLSRDWAPGEPVLAAGALVAALPLAWTLLTVGGDWRTALHSGLTGVEYARWILTTFTAIGATFVVAGAIALPARAAGLHRSPGIAAAALVVAFASAPAWGWLVVRWLLDGAGATALAVGVGVAGILTGLVGLWALSCVDNGIWQRREGRAVVKTILVVAALIVGNQFVLWAVVGQVSRSMTLGAAAALRLNGSWATADLAPVASATFVLTSAVAAVVCAAFRRWDQDG